MLISSKKKFVFFHIPKTAGGSITVLLSKYADIYNKNPRPLDKSKKGWMTRYHVPTKKQAYNHMHSFVDPMYNRFDCKNMFSFSFVRNPYARIMSIYRFLNGKYGNLTFLGFCQYLDVNKEASINQFTHLSLGHEIPLDFIGRFENIENDFNYVCEKINIPERYIDLGFEHKTIYPDYRQFYCDESKKIIDHIFDKDFKTFNYKKEL